MNFVSSQVLYLIPVLMPLIAWFLWWTWRKRQTLVRQFVSERLLPQLLEGVSPSRQKLKLTLLALSILFILLALSRPQWGFVWEEASQRGRDILVAIDTSKSMLAADMAPNRLQRAKLAALDLQRLAKNDRLGLIAFAGGAFLQSPLTLDDEAFRQNIEALDTSIIPQGGTSLAEAIDTAVSSFASEEGDNHRVMVIFTDGEDQDQGALQAAAKAADKNLKIFTVGVGTPAGELIRVTDERGQTSFIKDSASNAVKSRLNEDLLRQIATSGNGFYLALREGNAMQTLYQKGLEPMPTTEISSKLVRHLNEQFHWPLGIAIALLLTEILLPSSPKKRARTQPALVTIFLLFLIPSVEASPDRAFRDYKSGRYKDARNEYERLLDKKPDDPILNYNAGAASYKAGAYDSAVKQFSNAARAQDLNLQQSAYYNLGNANYRLGNDESDPQKKMGIWQQALQNFESSLKLNPKDADAAFNRDVVKQKLEELKKQQQQQQNQDQKKDDNKDKQENQDNKKQDQNKSDEQKKDQQKNDNKKDDQQQQQQQDQKDNEQQKSDQQKKDEEKKQQEQQQQQQQQGQEGDDKKDSQEKGGQPQAKNQDERDPQKEAEQEARAAQLGQMTPKQAQQMLDAQKTEERALIYRQPMERKRAREKALNDW